jgi:transposase
VYLSRWREETSRRCGNLRRLRTREQEQILERVAAIDVAKASGKVCTRVPHQSRPGEAADPGLGRGCHQTRSWSSASIWPVSGSRRVTLESTSDYWRIWFYLLEAAGQPEVSDLLV